MTELLGRLYPIVLAAGRSERMGSPKLLQDFDGKKCVTLVIEACLTACLGRPIIVLGHMADRIRKELPGGGVVIVENKEYNLGQTSSLLAGLGALPENAGGFFVLPADFPCMTGSVLRTLANTLDQRTNAAKRIFVPTCKGRGGHPVLIDIALKPEFAALPIEEPARSLVYQDLARVAYVEVNHRGILMDMDTTKDYFECLKEYRRGPGGHTTRMMRVSRETRGPTDARTPPGPGG